MITTANCCCEDDSRGNECPSSKDGWHCWHSPFNNGVYWSTVAPDPVCCHCGAKESSTHGPYHPLNKPLWNGTITGGSLGTGTITITNPSWITNPANSTVVWDAAKGGITYTANGASYPANGTAWAVPVATSGYVTTNGFSQVGKTCNCDGINTGCSNCTKL